MHLLLHHGRNSCDSVGVTVSFDLVFIYSWIPSGSEPWRSRTKPSEDDSSRDDAPRTCAAHRRVGPPPESERRLVVVPSDLRPCAGLWVPIRLFADDAVLSASWTSDLQLSLGRFVAESAAAKRRISTSKTPLTRQCLRLEVAFWQSCVCGAWNRNNTETGSRVQTFGSSPSPWKRRRGATF